MRRVTESPIDQWFMTHLYVVNLCRGSTMLTRLHAEGWCLVDFFKPADWIYRVHEKGGARLLGVVRLLGIIRYV